MLSSLLDESTEKFYEKTALVIDQQIYTYEALYERVRRLAASLLAEGLEEGDRVAFLLPNNLEIILCYYACFMIGAIAVPVNIHFNSKMIDYALRHSQACVFITTDQLYQRLLEDKIILTHIKRCYLVDVRNHAEAKDFQKLLSTPTSIMFNKVAKDRPSLIFFTSGTTGLPKAVVHTHHSLMQGTQNQIAHIRINRDDTTLIMFPMCYLIGLSSQLLPFHRVGATVVVSSKFESKLMLTYIKQHKVTKIYGFPKLYSELISDAEPTGCQDNYLNFCFSGGEAMPMIWQKKFISLFNIEITEGCGMSELQIYCMTPPYGRKKPGSMGLPIVGVEIQLIDENEKPIPAAHKVGEIIVCSSSMAAGYWQNNAITKERIRDGWFYTDDLAYRDEEGYYWFVSRKVDIIKKGEALISPLEIENIFYQHPAIKEVATIALPNPHKINDDKIIVYVQLKTESSLVTEQSLMDFAEKLLPDYKQPNQIILVKELPYGVTGKIDRKALKAKD